MQPNLFDIPEPAPFVAGSATSKEAAQAIMPKVGTLRELVLRYIRGCGETGATDEEIQRALNMGSSTERPRRIECVDRGWVRDSGRTRLTIAGRKASVWVVT